jgi:diacylglycerol kinase
LLAGFGYAFAGLAAAWRAQPNLRIQGVFAAVAVLVALALRVPAAAWALLALAIGLVLVAELFNTALEALVDLVSPDRHPLAKRAKDVAAAAVLVAAATALATGACIVVWAVRRT